eukprot:gene7272-8083_t
MEVYSWGANSYGQLALGNTEDYLLPQKIASFLKDDDIPVLLTGGGGHTVLLTDSGKLYLCGWNDCGQLGIGHTQNLMFFQMLSFKSKIKDVSCGWNHTLFVTDMGECFSFGSNAFHQLGNSQNKKEPLPNKVEGIPGRVAMVAAGMRHSVALTDDGSVYTWGCGRKGQLGHGQGPCSHVQTPSKVMFDEEVIQKDVKAGAEFTATLSVDGRVFCWGSNLYGQCGLPGPKSSVHVNTKTVKMVDKPIMVILDDVASKLHTGWSHVIIVTESNIVLSWGRGDYGQLGKGCSMSSYDPGIVDFAHESIASITGGSEHNIVCSDDGSVFIWGWNEHGMCGTGDEKNMEKPYHVTLFNNAKPFLIGCGAGTSFMVRACCSQKGSLITMIGLTTSFFFAEIIVGYATNSMALVADSFHMLSDVVSLFVGFFALKISQQAHRHNLDKNTFGWVRAEVLGALVNSVFLVALCFSIFVESLKRMVDPEGIKQPLLVLGVGTAGLVVNLLGICLFQGHMGHGHSHGGHSHSHGAGNAKPTNENSDATLTDVVITNFPAADKSGMELSTVDFSDGHGKSISDRDNVDDADDGDDSGDELSKHRVHASASRYQMGIMLAALQAEETLGENNDEGIVVIQNETINQSLKENDTKMKKKIKSGDQMNIKGVYLHILGDALGSVIVIASALAIYFGKGKWTLYIDPAMSIIMVAIILKSSVPLLKESSMVLLQTVPTHIQIQELEEKLLGNFPAILSVHEFHVWQLAGSKIVASLHLQLPSRDDYMGMSERIKIFFHDEGIHSTTIQPEFLEERSVDDGKSPCLLKCVSTTCHESVCCQPREEKTRLPTVKEIETREAASTSNGTDKAIDRLEEGIHSSDQVNEIGGTTTEMN